MVRTQCHELDLVLKTFGELRPVFSTTGSSGLDDTDVEDSVVSLFEARSEFGPPFIRYSASMSIKDRRRSVYVGGTKGWCSVDLLASTLAYGSDPSSAHLQRFDVSRDELFQLVMEEFLHPGSHEDQAARLSEGISLLELILQIAGDGS